MISLVFLSAWSRYEIMDATDTKPNIKQEVYAHEESNYWRQVSRLAVRKSYYLLQGKQKSKNKEKNKKDKPKNVNQSTVLVHQLSISIAGCCIIFPQNDTTAAATKCVRFFGLLTNFKFLEGL